MATIIYSSQALNDFDRLTDFLLLEFPQAALETIELIQEAINIIRHHPFNWPPGRSIFKGISDIQRTVRLYCSL